MTPWDLGNGQPLLVKFDLNPGIRYRDEGSEAGNANVKVSGGTRTFHEGYEITKPYLTSQRDWR